MRYREHLAFQLMVLLFFTLTCWVIVAIHAQTPGAPPSKYVIENCPDPTALTKGCSQSLRMQTAIEAEQIAQRDYSMALQALQKATAATNAEVTAIDKENGWPESVQLNRQTGQLADTKPPDPPAKPEPPEAKP